MIETKWTPGPWEVVSRFVGPLVVAAHCPTEVDRSGKMDVAHVGADTLKLAADNAHLIAAAPELYEALQRMVNHFTMLPPDYLTTPDSVIGQALSALSRARGEAS